MRAVQFSCNVALSGNREQIPKAKPPHGYTPALLA
jgi:hypothetical protein